MKRKSLFAVVLLGLSACQEVALTGHVSSVAEGPMEGVVVTAKREGSTIAVSVVSDSEGRYRKVAYFSSR